jgi:hypothetical protein
MIGFAFPSVSGATMLQIVSGIAVSLNSVALFALMMWRRKTDENARSKACVQAQFNR